jgi:hypothetical protein
MNPSRVSDLKGILNIKSFLVYNIYSTRVFEIKMFNIIIIVYQL